MEMEKQSEYMCLLPRLIWLSAGKNLVGWFSKDPGEFIEEIVKLTISFDLTWCDMQKSSSTCCTVQEKQKIQGIAHEHADGVAVHNPGHAMYHMGRDAAPDLDCQWNYQRGPQDLECRNHMLTCLIDSMKKRAVKPVNYEKVRDITQKKD